jgi:DNA-binding NtrC family response regulator
MSMATQNSTHTLHAEAALNQESHRVLIVDDEPAICFAYRKLLECERFNFDICETVEAAISLLQKETYFAVISDVRFGGSSDEEGVYLATVVRREQPESKMILVTGYGSDELKSTAYELGVSHYFEKPVKPSLILTLLRALHVIADEVDENKYLMSILLTNTSLS